MTELPKPNNDQDRTLISDVERHGWHVIKVPELENSPGWVFSIGLHHSFGHPEVVVFGLPDEMAHQMINSLGDDIREGAKFEPDTLVTGVLEDYSCSIKTVDPYWYPPFLGYATWFYQGLDFPVVQCLWPDREGNLPNEAAFDTNLIPFQPLLWHADPIAARAEKLLATLDD